MQSYKKIWTTANFFVYLQRKIITQDKKTKKKKYEKRESRTKDNGEKTIKKT